MCLYFINKDLHILLQQQKIKLHTHSDLHDLIVPKYNFLDKLNYKNYEKTITSNLRTSCGVLGYCPKPRSVTPKHLGPTPRAWGSIPRVWGSIPRAWGSIPRAWGSIPRAWGSNPRACKPIQ